MARVYAWISATRGGGNSEIGECMRSLYGDPGPGKLCRKRGEKNAARSISGPEPRTGVGSERQLAVNLVARGERGRTKRGRIPLGLSGGGDMRRVLIAFLSDGFDAKEMVQRVHLRGGCM